MRTLISLVILTLASNASCQSHSGDRWLLQVNTAGRAELTSNSVATISGKQYSCSLTFYKPKDAKIMYSLDFRIAGVGQIPNFHFDDFEGPDAQVHEPLMTMSLLVDGKEKYRTSFCPTGAYVDTPSDGFSFGLYSEGDRSPISQLIRSVTTGAGILRIYIIDSKGSKAIIQADFDLRNSTKLFNEFENTK